MISKETLKKALIKALCEAREADKLKLEGTYCRSGLSPSIN
jgi:hypothetical protein